MLILCAIIFFVIIQILVLICCAAAGNDPDAQAVADQEQTEFLQNWEKAHSLAHKK